MAESISSKLLEGEYDSFGVDAAFAAKLQTDLREVNNDKHLRIGFGERRLSGGNYGESYPQGLGEVEILDNDIAYLAISHFPTTNSNYKKVLADKMDQIRGSSSLIIDMRYNRGGSPGTVQLVSSYFLPPDTHLNTLYFRTSDRTDQFNTLDHIDGERMEKMPIYLLTSNRTFSAGEEFSYNLKHLERATLIGETTGGGAHPVNRYNLPSDFYAIIPIGMAINPITKTNWEGVGVIPHISAPEDAALERALEIANTN